MKARTVSLRELERERTREQKSGREALEIIDYQRPTTREDCRGKVRPCLFVACTYHLYLEVTDKGSIVLNYPQREPWELEETCALDIAEKEDGSTLETIGDYLNLTRERVRQIERSALDKLKADGKVEL